MNNGNSTPARPATAKPVTYAEMGQILVNEIEALQLWRDEFAGRGEPWSATLARKLAAYEAMLRLIDRITSDRVLLDLIAGKTGRAA